MGLYDRDYMRATPDPPSVNVSFRSNRTHRRRAICQKTPPHVMLFYTWLVTLVYLTWLLCAQGWEWLRPVDSLLGQFSLSNRTLPSEKYWSLVLYAFSETRVVSAIFHLSGVVLFGILVEYLCGSIRTLLLTAISAILGALVVVLAPAINASMPSCHFPIPVITDGVLVEGASAIVASLCVAACVISPGARSPCMSSKNWFNACLYLFAAIFVFENVLHSACQTVLVITGGLCGLVFGTWWRLLTPRYANSSANMYSPDPSWWRSMACRCIAPLVMVVSLYGGFIADDAPAKNLCRSITSKSHTCLICNRPAVVSRVYSEGDGRGIPYEEYFCERHPPPPKIIVTLHPAIEKYFMPFLATLFWMYVFLLSFEWLDASTNVSSEEIMEKIKKTAAALGMAWLCTHVMLLAHYKWPL